MRVDAALWLQLKELVEHASAWPMDTLHVVGGVLLQLGFAALFRTGVGNRGPWLAVFALQLLNEAHDLWIERWPSMAMQIGEGLRDTVSTMFLPTLLLILARRRPLLLTKRP